MEPINWDKRLADFEKLSAGARIVSEDNIFYLKPQQNDNLEGMVISLHDGSLHHFSVMGHFREAFK